MNKINQVTTTLPSAESANELIERLVADGLAACGSRYLINSCYIWHDKLMHDQECEIVLKTSISRTEDLINELTSLHPYETPYIASVTMEVNESYYRWVEAQCSEQD